MPCNLAELWDDIAFMSYDWEHSLFPTPSQIEVDPLGSSSPDQTIYLTVSVPQLEARAIQPMATEKEMWFAQEKPALSGK
jgi:hypothetical protein